MPLHDHFRPPGNRLPWPSLHSGWISELAGRVNAQLPDGYVALDSLNIEGVLEVDVGDEEGVTPDQATGGAGGTAVAAARAVYTPPPATGAAEYRFPDVAELRVLSERGSNVLVGAVELVSPNNKDRETSREAFLSKCVDYLAGGACVVVVDIVTDRHANLHNEIVERIGAGSLALPDDVRLYAATYRPVVRAAKSFVDVWVEPLKVGDPLPTMPLRLVNDLFIPIELEWAYTEACRRRKFRV
jgi:hypothetical protein